QRQGRVPADAADHTRGQVLRDLDRRGPRTIQPQRGHPGHVVDERQRTIAARGRLGQALEISADIGELVAMAAMGHVVADQMTELAHRRVAAPEDVLGPFTRPQAQACRGAGRPRAAAVEREGQRLAAAVARDHRQDAPRRTDAQSGEAAGGGAEQASLLGPGRIDPPQVGQRRTRGQQLRGINLPRRILRPLLAHVLHAVVDRQGGLDTGCGDTRGLDTLVLAAVLAVILDRRPRARPPIQALLQIDQPLARRQEGVLADALPLGRDRHGRIAAGIEPVEPPRLVAALIAREHE
ncbi:conserved hypothetical protein, partial [Ricinus communis]